MYTVSIHRGKEVTVEMDGKTVEGYKTNLTEEEVRNIMENYNLEEVAYEVIWSL